MTNSGVQAPDWSHIPAPEDDGAARHLAGMRMASLSLTGTDGQAVDLSALPGRAVIYAYPRTGRPGVDNPDGWDMIPGARGCSPQSCAFRDHFAVVTHVFYPVFPPDRNAEAVIEWLAARPETGARSSF
jgi:hypothetical protein